MVRAKFKVESVAPAGDEGSNITLRAVYDADPNSENGKFFKYTPSGQITLAIVSPETASTFEAGKSFYVDFTEAE